MNADRDNSLEQVIAWLVHLQSGEFDAAQQRELDAWCAASPRNAQTLQRLRNGLAPLASTELRQLPGDELLKIVQAPSSRRQFLRGGSTLLGLGASGALLERIARVGPALPGDLYTGIGERHTWWLRDGSRLDLNARSIARLDSHAPRHLSHRQGELLLQVNRDASPFLLRSMGRTLHLDHGRFLLRQEGDRLRLITFEQGARLVSTQHSQHALAARRSLLFDHQRIYSETPSNNQETAWLDGWLVLRNHPLSRLVDSLGAYHYGLLRISTAAARLRVTGRYPLDDVPRCLDLLASGLPLAIQRTPFFTTIDLT
ncbi:iron dicitrate transport regulator FecR [Stutzerimonas kirkiae]|uniref:Iron dicitrate transport regulator FecR n=1 Tax=Stutzerimonas kirkiae TaxID=2211392 RepID=A0A4V2KBU1_9GAMM|nr:DUF4880 domain-containing protein [Stutzerimonas kirkiae]TBU88671.1 iron dicitrate transport regulator FecR [Stutzerimonas kirkiae]TBU98509.1 iron dicitrate transport regulator FecR [Stutzerimonas kirkiae]TBV15416.1 iron dicitrate transport regulator FecR [Stutzerimonas kirkiae]